MGERTVGNVGRSCQTERTDKTSVRDRRLSTNQWETELSVPSTQSLLHRSRLVARPTDVINTQASSHLIKASSSNISIIVQLYLSVVGKNPHHGVYRRARLAPSSASWCPSRTRQISLIEHGVVDKKQSHYIKWLSFTAS